MRNTKPRVSLAMVVKNEAAGIRAAIESALPVVDDVLVHDTGSTDGTQDIARELGARVVEEPWRADFSYHRNLSISEAKGDWIFILDGDEILKEPADLRETIDAAWQMKLDGIFTYVCSVTETDRVAERERQIRAFDRSRIRYKFPIHNQPFGHRGDKMVACNAVVWAYYRQDDGKDRIGRALPRLLAMLEENEPGSEAHQHALCFLARTYAQINAFPEMKHYARQALDNEPSKLGFANLWPVLIRATLAEDGPEAGIKVCDEALSHHPDYGDLWWWRARVDLWSWAHSCREGSPYLFVPQEGLGFVRNLYQAGDLLGMPFRPPVKEGAA